jgi:hypothetical protein
MKAGDSLVLRSYAVTDPCPTRRAFVESAFRGTRRPVSWVHEGILLPVAGPGSGILLLTSAVRRKRERPRSVRGRYTAGTKDGRAFRTADLSGDRVELRARNCGDIIGRTPWFLRFGTCEWNEGARQQT